MKSWSKGLVFAVTAMTVAWLTSITFASNAASSGGALPKPPAIAPGRPFLSTRRPPSSRRPRRRR